MSINDRLPLELQFESASLKRALVIVFVTDFRQVLTIWTDLVNVVFGMYLKGRVLSKAPEFSVDETINNLLLRADFCAKIKLMDGVIAPEEKQNILTECFVTLYLKFEMESLLQKAENSLDADFKDFECVFNKFREQFQRL